VGKRRTIATVLVTLIVVGGAAYWWQAGGQQQQRPGGRGFRGDDGPVPVIAAIAKRADVPVYLDGVGTTKALNTVTVRPQVDGRLISINFKEGQQVDQGYVLAQVDPTTYQASYDQTVAKKAQDEALLANAKIDLDRYARLVATNSIARQQLDTQKATVAQLEAQVKLDQAAIDNAQAILGYTTITAPLAGRTGIRLVDQGNYVRAADANGLVVITQIQPISVLFTLPQQQLGEINRASAQRTLQVEVLGPDNKTAVERGELRVVDNQVDQTTGTIKLKAEFPNSEFQLWPGQFVNVRLLINTLDQVVTTPTAAVQRGPNGTFVYVVQPDNKVAIRPVTVSQQDEAQSVIARGLQADERVVTTGFARLTAGADVTVTNAESIPAAGAPTAESEQRQRRNRGERGERGRDRRSELSPPR
jgi:multidrug efflux system membrane fusion protein